MSPMRDGPSDAAAPTEGDHALLQQFLDSAGFSPAEQQALSAWWREECRPGEGLAEVLSRFGVLAVDALKTFALMQKGYIQMEKPHSLFEASGVERVRAVLARRVGTGTSTDTAKPSRSPSPTPLMVRRPSPNQLLAATQSRAVAIPPVSRNDEATLNQVIDVSSASATGRGGEPARANSGPRIGITLGRCLLTEILGRGATGVVYRALHQSLNISVAVKVLRRAAMEDSPQIRQTLLSEARLLAQMNHPNVVRVWDLEDDPEFPYLVLEYVEGLSLGELIQQSGRLRVDRAAVIIGQVASGLAEAQRLGIVHRDVKPANVLLTRTGAAKIADLGVATLVGDRRREADATGGTAGTVAYMSPEQAAGEPTVDHRSDIYSLGVTFYHAVTGQLPFEGRSRMVVMLKHAKEEPVPPHQLAPEVGVEASAVILRMMAKEQLDRHQTYAELLADLARLSMPSAAQVIEAAPAVAPLASTAPSADAVPPAAESAPPPAINTETASRKPFWKSVVTMVGRSINGEAPKEES